MEFSKGGTDRKNVKLTASKDSTNSTMNNTKKKNLKSGQRKAKTMHVFIRNNDSTEGRPSGGLGGPISPFGMHLRLLKS